MLLTKDFLARLEALEIVSRRIRRGAFRGERRSVRRGASVEFSDHRPYGTGDDLRFLDWNLYARLELLMTKLFHDGGPRRPPDPRPQRLDGLRRPDGPRAEGLAAIGYVALLGMNRVTCGARGERGPPLRDLRSAQGTERMLAALEEAKVGGASFLGEPLRRYVGTRRPRGVLVVASDLLHPDGAWEPLRALVRGGLEVHLIRVSAPEEEKPPVEGDLRLIDVEDASGVDVTVTPKLLALYDDARTSYDRRLEEFCRSRQVMLAACRTDESVERLVLDVLRARGLLA
jgi:uncharacterized protein (DUF58 family)